MPTYPRVSGRLGNILDLNITFYRDGIPTDPFAVRKVAIYRSAVQPENLVAQLLITDPLDPNYPSPLMRELDTGEIGQCGTVPPPGAIKPGIFHLFWDVPKDGITVPDIFFDVWSYIPTQPDGLVPEAGETDLVQEYTARDQNAERVITIPGGAPDFENLSLVPDDTDFGNDVILNDESRWQSCCNKFWLYNDNFFCDDGLENIRLGFEAMDSKFYQPEIKMLEVGLMPLPLYDFDYNKIAPIIPNLVATLSLFTDNNETLILDAPTKIGLRQGTYRSNPFVIQYLFDSSLVIKGSYKYQITLRLPNGETRTSPKFNIQVS